MWKLQPEVDYETRVRHWPKKHRRELEAMHDNLDTLIGAINQGALLGQIRFGFIHDEPNGVKAIDQKGAGAGVKQTRRYVYPDVNTHVVHLITVGDKNFQKQDIRLAIDFVDRLDAGEGGRNG